MEPDDTKLRFDPPALREWADDVVEAVKHFEEAEGQSTDAALAAMKRLYIIATSGGHRPVLF